MTARPESQDYDRGYADGVRDAAAWTAQRVAALLSVTGAALRAGLRELHTDAGTRWARWADRRDWPSMRRLVARARRSGAP